MNGVAKTICCSVLCLWFLFVLFLMETKTKKMYMNVKIECAAFRPAEMQQQQNKQFENELTVLILHRSW